MLRIIDTPLHRHIDLAHTSITCFNGTFDFPMTQNELHTTQIEPTVQTHPINIGTLSGDFE